MKRKLKEYDEYYEVLENGKTVYYKDNNGYSRESTYDKQGNRLTFKNSDGYSYEYTYDNNNNVLTYKNSDGYSYEYTYDKRGNISTFKDSDDYSYECTYDDKGKLLIEIVNGKLVTDNRPKEITITLTQEQLDKMREAGII